MRRQSHFISRRQATNTRPAILLADKNGMPLNYAVTINFHHTEANAESAADRFAALRARFTRWAGKPPKKTGGKPFTPAFLWVLENTGHVAAHWLVHIPKARLTDFKERLPVWLERSAGPVSCPSAIDIRAAYNPHGYRKYMLKGINPASAALYRINHVPQGLIIGKRFGFSASISPSQCRKHGTKTPWRRPVKQPRPAA